MDLNRLEGKLGLSPDPVYSNGGICDGLALTNVGLFSNGIRNIPLRNYELPLSAYDLLNSNRLRTLGIPSLIPKPVNDFNWN